MGIYHFKKVKRHPSRVAVSIMTAMFLMAASGCGNSAESGKGAGRPVVLTTFTITADMVRNVAGDHLSVSSITKPGAEIHDYEPTASDIVKASQADLIIDNGLGLERWFDRFVENSKAERVTVSEGVTPIDISEGEYQGKANPHAWMSPKNGQTYIDNIVTALSDIDAPHAAEYRSNGDAYKKKLQSLSDGLSKELSELPSSQRTLVSCAGAFSYLARDADMQELYLWPVNAESEGTPQQIAKVVDAVKRDRIYTVFCESTVNGKAMQQVASETGAVFRNDDRHMLYVDSLSRSDGPVPTYLKLLEHDADAIVSGLTGGASKFSD